MRGRLILRCGIAVAACAMVTAANGQPAPSDSGANPVWIRRVSADLINDGLLSIRNGAHVITAPGRASPDAWAAGLYAGAAIGVFAMLDEPMRSLAQSQRTAQRSRIMDVCELYGATPVVSSLAVGIYLCGLGLGHSALRETGRSAVVSVVLAATVSAIIKAGTGRSRPYLDNGSCSFAPFSANGGRHSFPSGHCTAAFALSSALSMRIRNGWATAGLYGLALAVAAQRIYDDRHWLSDAVAGAVIGTATGIFVVRDSQRQPPGKNGRVGIAPLLAPRRQGIALSLSI